jgi:hypothetical protein
MLTNEELDAQIIELERRRRFTLYADLNANSTKDWQVHNLLGAGEASAMYGKPGDGKSVLAQDLGLHVAAGWDWHGRGVKRGAVVYIALERRKLVERRAIAFRARYRVPELPFAIVGGVHDFRDPRTATDIAAVVREVEQATGETVVLIIIDTISRALCGGDENSPKDMGAIVNATSLLQDKTKAHVLWLHHMPMDGSDRMRGHGALLGALDTTIHVVKTDGIRTATVVKANDSEEGERITFGLESVVIGQDADGNETSAPIVVPLEAAKPVAKPQRVPRAAQTALRALAKAIEECGENAPASNHIPTGTRITTIDRWRQYAYNMGISASEEPRAKQKAFKEGSDRLIADQQVAVWADHVWLAR